MPWLASHGTEEQRAYFTETIAPTIARALVKRSYPNETCVPEVQKWVQWVLRSTAACMLRANTAAVLYGVLAELFAPTSALYMMHGHPEGPAADSTADLLADVAWRFEMYPTMEVDVEHKAGQWVTGAHARTLPRPALAILSHLPSLALLSRSLPPPWPCPGMIADMSPTQTEVEVQYMADSKPHSRWLATSSPALERAGQGAKQQQRRDASDRDLPDEEPLEYWRGQLAVGSQVDVRDKEREWFTVGAASEQRAWLPRASRPRVRIAGIAVAAERDPPLPSHAGGRGGCQARPAGNARSPRRAACALRRLERGHG